MKLILFTRKVILIPSKTRTSAFWEKNKSNFIYIIIPDQYFPEFIVLDEDYAPPNTGHGCSITRVTYELTSAFNVLNNE